MIITEAINAIYSWCYTTLGFVYATSANDSDTSHTICDRMIWSHKNLLIYPAVGCFLRLSVFPPAVYPAVGCRVFQRKENQVVKGKFFAMNTS